MVKNSTNDYRINEWELVKQYQVPGKSTLAESTTCSKCYQLDLALQLVAKSISGINLKESWIPKTQSAYHIYS